MKGTQNGAATVSDTGVDSSAAVKCRGAPPEENGQNHLTDTVTHMVNGRKFIIEPVFKKDSPETLGSIFLKLMLMEDSFF